MFLFLGLTKLIHNNSNRWCEDAA